MRHRGQGPFFRIEKGRLLNSSEPAFPAITSDRLALVAASGFTAFRPVCDALTARGFYNLNPKLMRELQKSQDGRLLKAVGENTASVTGHLERVIASGRSRSICRPWYRWCTTWSARPSACWRRWMRLKAILFPEGRLGSQGKCMFELQNSVKHQRGTWPPGR